MSEEEQKPEPEKKKRTLPEALKQYQFKPKQSGNPLGARVVSAKVLSKLDRAWGQATAPDTWFGDIEHLLGKNLTIDELIIIRVKYCLAKNIKFHNPALLKEMRDRYEGKVPLVVKSKGPDDATDDFSELSDEELAAYIAGLDARALAAAGEQKQLTEGQDAEAIEQPVEVEAHQE